MSFQEKLLNWFQKNQRPLPWRKTYEPYQVWVSEIMLQQTQVATALPYFERWVKTFPTLRSLAESDEKKVLKHWEGLGYYSRARNIHETSKQIVKDHGGKFPEDFESILKLKGVGRYTAGAIASIAFNQDKPIVDGNVLRVLARLFAISKPIDDLKYREEFWALQESLIPKGKARFFNQALMELGALICTPKNPSCLICPLQSKCKAFKQKSQESYPVKSKKKIIVKVEACAAILEKDGKYFIHRRPVGKIMGGLWEFPEWKISKEELSSCLKNDFGIEPKKIDSLGKIKRNYTHHNETLNVFRITVSKNQKLSLKNNWESVWISKEDFKKYPFSAAHAKISRLI